MSYSADTNYSQSYTHYPSQAYTQYTSTPYQNSQYSQPASQYGVYSQFPLPGTYTLPSSYLSDTKPSIKPSDPPDLTSAITPKIACDVIRRLITTQLRSAGFDAAEPEALQKLEEGAIDVVTLLYERAHEFANLANRARPIAKDLLLAQAEVGMDTTELWQVARKTKKRKHQQEDGYEPVALESAPPETPPPKLLPSDDESSGMIIPTTLATLKYENLPKLPPKHTYLMTPASPPKKAAPSSLEKKLKNAGLVQESLKNLLLATEDTTGQEDGELLGHIVNWEAHIYPRKRWRVGV
ncbi:hypothetical protein NEOLEDRAFT_1131453 [Neolentinus lepideus HHB14362 ss-1]|uniref:Transcription initiation factor TFIID subunit 8 n=1 Tax=Neolentinus lepideus HHB14362 ss-1 TaxID=1314782 RepID=A0A165TP69_9AGAM|nr:hypothetical protein NEOLEDRAFT_1131453 [Neolentinus lepideus HHB14362 ss-1]